MKRRGKSDHELEYIASRVCTYRCGLADCDLTFTGRLDDWLTIRADHRDICHPDWRPRKRKYPHTPKHSTRREHDGTLVYRTEKEMTLA